MKRETLWTPDGIMLEVEIEDGDESTGTPPSRVAVAARDEEGKVLTDDQVCEQAGLDNVDDAYAALLDSVTEFFRHADADVEPLDCTGCPECARH